jgi:hypothetical protein
MIIPEGYWVARACKGALTRSRTGTPEVAVDLEIQDIPARGMRITWHGYLSDKAFANTIEKLHLMGWEGDDLNQLRGLDRNAVRVRVQHKPLGKGGALVASAEWIHEIEDSPTEDPTSSSTPMTAREAKAFAARMRPRVVAASVRIYADFDNHQHHRRQS